MIRSPGANGPPLGSPEAALNMQALLNELIEQFDQWWAVTQRRQEIIRLLDA
jgi:hypothetical protein